MTSVICIVDSATGNHLISQNSLFLMFLTLLYGSITFFFRSNSNRKSHLVKIIQCNLVDINVYVLLFYMLLSSQDSVCGYSIYLSILSYKSHKIACLKVLQYLISH